MMRKLRQNLPNRTRPPAISASNDRKGSRLAHSAISLPILVAIGHSGRRASRSNQAQFTSGALAPREPGKFLHHALIDRPLEGNDQVGEVLHRLPAPADELRLVTAAGARDIDFGVLTGETHRVPFLPLAAIAALPGAPGDGARDVVDQPVRDLAELLDRADAGLLVELALGR